MSENVINIRFKVNLPVIFFAVLLLHLSLMLVKGLPRYSANEMNPNPEPIQLNIRKVKTKGSEHRMVKATESVIDAGGQTTKALPSSSPSPRNAPSLSDLGVGSNSVAPKVTRPGARPEVKPIQVMREMNKISMKSKEFKDFSKSFPSGGLAISDMVTGAQKVSDAVVSIEVPDGVNPDELNQYELMFYGFQKRTSVAYLNSILSNLNKFQKRYPGYKVPKEGTITMTARVSYDKEGNVKQIKMVRWTHVNELQGLFEDIVKKIDQLHNPPKVLWERDEEFAMFYTLQIVNG